MHKKKLFCIVGETGSGKDTIITELVKREPNVYKEICSYTTRPKRENETNGVEHYFLTKEEFDELRYSHIDRILSYTKIASKEYANGYEYMALLDELNDSNIYTIDPIGLEYLKVNFFDRLRIITIYIYAPYTQRKRRVLDIRKDNEEDFNNRVKAEHRQFDIFRGEKSYDYVLYNFDGQLENCINTCQSIMNYELNERNIGKELVTGDKFNMCREDLNNALTIIKDMGDYYHASAPNRYMEIHYDKYIRIAILALLDKISNL